MTATPPRIEVVAGGPPSPEEVAALTAALDVLLAPDEGNEPAASAWRWSGRWWRHGGTDWRNLGGPAHPSRP